MSQFVRDLSVPQEGDRPNNCSSDHSIDALLASFGPFGVELGLERITRLLDDLGNPHHRVPIIHVAGTNGKGSVCAYLSSILKQAGYRVGRYISPHLVSWRERICINDMPIESAELYKLLLEIQQKIHQATRRDRPSPTQFEVITAAAWLYFARQAVDVAVMEVGLGGRLDATNVCDRPLVTVVTSISREHWQRLGPTVADIAGEKAGILKSGCPAVIGELPPEADAVVRQRIEALGCPAFWVPPAEDLGHAQARYRPVYPSDSTSESDSISNTDTAKDLVYPLPLPGPHQLMNSALAIATLQVLRDQGWGIPDAAIVEGLRQTRWPGRIQWVTWRGHQVLIDGAHNPAAAAALRQYVDRRVNESVEGGDRPLSSIHWVMGMLSTKDHGDVFKALLRDGDALSLVPVPDHSTADPATLAALAQSICPTLNPCSVYGDVFEALEAAIRRQDSLSPSPTIVLCGSLYLIGHFFRNCTTF